MKRIMITALLAVTLATITGCAKDGINGRDGKDGLGGNANLEQFTYTIQSNQWYTRGTFQQPGFQYYHQIDAPEVTQSVMDNGAVMVYIKQSDLFYPLPAITDYETYVTTVQFNVYLGMVEVFIEDTDFQTQAPGAMTLKVVVFDQLNSLPKNLDIKNYKQVLAYMNQ
jgi:hypothetical protein